jgi:hypothetical protein
MKLLCFLHKFNSWGMPSMCPRISILCMTCVGVAYGILLLYVSGYSFASVLKSSLNGGSLPTTIASTVLLITPLHGPSRKHLFQQHLYCCMRIRCCWNMFTKPLPRNGSTCYNTETMGLTASDSAEEKTKTRARTAEFKPRCSINSRLRQKLSQAISTGQRGASTRFTYKQHRPEILTLRLTPRL